ncbi:pyrroline-5-carboxylate reductase [bacterium]|nr:pyrroline-5-carboxylate reductase [bacterium]
MKKKHIAILGAGNIGIAIAEGLYQSKQFQMNCITLTRRKVHLLDDLAKKGFKVQKDNIEAVRNSEVIIIAVEPQQLDDLLMEIQSELSIQKHVVISLVSGVKIDQIHNMIGQPVPIVRAMPNTAIAIGESMTCLVSESSNEKALQTAIMIFKAVGKTLVIDEEQMIAATALGACGVAFFLRAIRAASQGGIEIGFHYHEALMIAAQTAKGAASLLLDIENHPEHEIDKVTTPRGCTISGLNQMEHEGFSSALIKGITTSAEKASKLYIQK